MGGGGDGTSSARLGGGRRKRELSEINKNWEMVRGLKDSQPVGPVTQTGRTGLARTNKNLTEKFSSSNLVMKI